MNICGILKIEPEKEKWIKYSMSPKITKKKKNRMKLKRPKTLISTYSKESQIFSKPQHPLA